MEESAFFMLHAPANKWESFKKKKTKVMQRKVKTCPSSRADKPLSQCRLGARPVLDQLFIWIRLDDPCDSFAMLACRLPEDGWFLP